MLIVLEGLDGAGKSTQISMLQSHYQGAGKSVKFLHFPRFETPIYGELIAKFLRGELGSIESVHPMLVALLFAQDRYAASAQLNEWLDNDNIVILDRYIYSNIAFQCAKSPLSEQKSLRDWIFDLEFKFFAIPKPYFNLFLDVPIGFVREKLKVEREGDDRSYLEGKRDIHEANLEFQKAVREVYLKECERGEGLIRVNCSSRDEKMLPADEIFAKILRIVNE